MKRIGLSLFLIIIVGVLFSSCSKDNASKTLAKENDARLNSSIQSGNLERVKEAIEDGANMNKIKVSSVSEENPVIIAINKNKDKISKYLIENGADANYTDSSGRSLLMLEAYNTDSSFCKLLMKHGAKVNQEDKKGYSALEYVLDHSRRETTEHNIDEIITDLLEHGAEIRPITLKAVLKGGADGGESRYGLVKRILEGSIKVGLKSELDPALESAILGQSSKIDEFIKANKMKNEDEQQILFYTAAFGNSETMKSLESNGLNLEAIDKNGCTPLIIASYYGNLEVAKYLLSKSVNTESRTPDNNGKKTALNFAVENEQYEIAELLIKKGADVKPYTIFSGTVDILSEAAGNGDIRMMKLIIENGYTLNEKNIGKAMAAACSKNKVDALKYFLDMGMYANIENNGLHILQECNNLDAVRLLVEHGSSINGKNANGGPLRSAASIDIAEFLIKKGANVNSIAVDSKGKKGNSILMRYIMNGDFDMVKLLVENGTDLNYQSENDDRDTAIMWAAGQGSRNILEYLIKNGSTINYQNEKGETALMRSVAQGQLDCVRMLIKYKVDTSLKDKEGHTALDIAK
jgi:ankyrin repeat protein